MTRAEYNTNARTLTIYFEDGSIYRYEAVTQNTVTAFRNSRDPDEYFNDSIRDSFKFTRLTPTKIRTPRRSRNRSNRTAATRTPVRCAALNQLQRQNVVSEALAAVAYDDATQCLVVYFDRRGTYAYANVPKDVYRRLLQTGPDPAIYFNESVRTRYRNQRLAN